MSRILTRRETYHRGALPRAGVLVAILAVSTAPLSAQVDPGRRIYDEQLRVRLDQQMPSARETGFDAGGWFSFAFFNYTDALNDQHTLRQYELRAWGSLSVREVHKFYVRGLYAYDDWNSDHNPKGYVGDEDRGPSVERAWYQFDLGRMLKNQTGQRPPAGFRFKVGRQFTEIGTALVLSMPLDAIRFDVEIGDWELMALLGRTIRETPNIDPSMPVATHQNRCFWGFELAYNGFDRHRPFVYFLSNEDHTSPRPDRPLGGAANQDFDYSSRYLGIGSEGTVFFPGLRYQAEFVGEWGQTYSENVVSGQDDICAWAADVLLEYLFETPMRPKVMVEYLYATGDSDRRSSSTATVGGNLAGTTDRAFNAFGFRDTGLAFAPNLSNLHVYTLGASFYPLENHELFKKLEIGSKAFFYHKDKSGGPISDTTANTTEQWVGWEWDVYCNWRITSDLSWSLRYGAFQPGTAFENQDCRHFLYTGVTFSF